MELKDHLEVSPWFFFCQLVVNFLAQAHAKNILHKRITVVCLYSNRLLSGHWKLLDNKNLCWSSMKMTLYNWVLFNKILNKYKNLNLSYRTFSGYHHQFLFLPDNLWLLLVFYPYRFLFLWCHLWCQSKISNDSFSCQTQYSLSLNPHLKLTYLIWHVFDSWD